MATATNTYPNQNPALRHHLLAWHETLTIAMTMNNLHNMQRPMVEIIVRMVMRNAVEYIILLSMVGVKSTTFVAIMLILLTVGQICDAHGHDIPLNTPPPPRDSDRGPHDWTPYNSRNEFELANFLFHQNQMSAGDIDSLLKIWAATLAPHNDHPPFRNHTELYNTIDTTPIGDVPWESFTVTYNGDIPDGKRLPWMEEEFEVWFRNPKELVQNMLANPDFNDEFDCSPFHEYDKNDRHRFHNFMSGDWAWKQAVCIYFTLARTTD